MGEVVRSCFYSVEERTRRGIQTRVLILLVLRTSSESFSAPKCFRISDQSLPINTLGKYPQASLSISLLICDTDKSHIWASGTMALEELFCYHGKALQAVEDCGLNSVLM